VIGACLPLARLPAANGLMAEGQREGNQEELSESKE